MIDSQRPGIGPGVEVVMLGYNTPFDQTGHRDIDSLTQFHNHLSMQAGASEIDLGDRQSQMRRRGRIKYAWRERYHRAVRRDRCAGGVAGRRNHTARCDLDLGTRYRETIAKERESEAYRLIVERKGAMSPREA